MSMPAKRFWGTVGWLLTVSHSQAGLVGYIPASPSSDYSPFYVNDDGFRGDDLGEAVAMDGDWLLLGEFGDCTTNCQSDLDSDGDVDIDDMLAMIGAWGPYPR